MRKVATIPNPTDDIRRVMTYATDAGAYLFLYATLQDGPCQFDEWYDSLALAEEEANARFGLTSEDWKMIEDPPIGAQHDWICPTRVKRDSAGNRLWGHFEDLTTVGVAPDAERRIVMQPPSDTITDVWFRSALELAEIVETLGLSDVSFDAEDCWQWAIGALDGIQLDVTRSREHPAASVDTRLFRLDNGPISNAVLATLIERLRTIACGRISWGRWVYRQGNDFDLQAVGHTPGG